MAECCVCFRKYDRAEHKPMCLPCGHALCQQCVQTLADTVRAHKPDPNDPYVYRPLGCPVCRHPVQDWLALPVNRPVLDILEQQSSLTSENSGEQPSNGRIDSSRVVHRALSTTRRTGGSSSYREVQGTSSAIAYHVTQLRSKQLLQQLQAVTALAGLTAYPAEEDLQHNADAAPAGETDLTTHAAAAASAAAAAGQDPDHGPYSSASAAAAADADTQPSSSSEIERYHRACSQVVDAGGFPALVALLQQTHEQGSAAAADSASAAVAGDRDLTRAAEVQRLGAQVLFYLLVSSTERYQLAVDAGVVPVLQQLLRCPRGDTQLLAVNSLLALAESTQPAVQAAVLRPELFAPATALLESDSSLVQVSSIELLQCLLKEQQQQPNAAAAAAAAPAAAAGGLSNIQTTVVALARLLDVPIPEVREKAGTALWAYINMARPHVVAQQLAALLCNSCRTTQLAGFDLLVGLLMEFSKEVTVDVLGSAGVIEASLRLLGSYEPAVQAAAAKAAAVLASSPQGVAVFVSIPQAVQQLAGLLRREGTQESAASALRWIAENSIMPFQLEVVRESCAVQLRAAGAIPAALNLIKASLNPGGRFRPSGDTLRSVMRVLQCCSMRPDAAAVIRQAGGLQVLQQVLLVHPDAEVRQWADGMLHQGVGGGLA